MHGTEACYCRGACHDASGTIPMEMQHPNFLILLRIGAVSVGAHGLTYRNGCGIKSSKREFGTFFSFVVCRKEIVFNAIAIKIKCSAILCVTAAGARITTGEIFEIRDALTRDLRDGHNGLRTIITRKDGKPVIVDDDFAAINRDNFLVAGRISTARLEYTGNLIFGLLCGSCPKSAAAFVLAFD